MISLLFLACTAEDPRVELIRSWGDKIFIPSYKSFADQSQELHTASISFCTNPNPTSLTELQQQWWQAREPWKHMEILSFGPYKNLPQRLGPQIDFWPIRSDTVDEILAGEQSLSLESFDSFGASSNIWRASSSSGM